MPDLEKGYRDKLTPLADFGVRFKQHAKKERLLANLVDIADRFNIEDHGALKVANGLSVISRALQERWKHYIYKAEHDLDYDGLLNVQRLGNIAARWEALYHMELRVRSQILGELVSDLGMFSYYPVDASGRGLRRARIEVPSDAIIIDGKLPNYSIINYMGQVTSFDPVTVRVTHRFPVSSQPTLYLVSRASPMREDWVRHPERRYNATGVITEGLLRAFLADHVDYANFLMENREVRAAPETSRQEYLLELLKAMDNIKGALQHMAVACGLKTARLLLPILGKNDIVKALDEGRDPREVAHLSEAEEGFEISVPIFEPLLYIIFGRAPLTYVRFVEFDYNSSYNQAFGQFVGAPLVSTILR